jgi:cyclophilin family peptidyl-prolyl cis-trans isomerase
MPRAREKASTRAKPKRAARPRPRRPRAKTRSAALGHQAARILALAAALAGGSSCGRGAPAGDPSAAGIALVADGPHEVAVLVVEGVGEIRFELLSELAPATVESWKALAAEGYFDRTTFHRVIPGFMIQGGDPNTRNQDPRDDGQGGPSFTLPDEFTSYPLRRGTVAMAHKGHRNTAGSQFFILHGDAPHLDGKYTAFGRVVQGMDVVDAITRMEIDKYGRFGPRDRPYPTPALIESVAILPAGAGLESATPRLDPPRPAG